MNLQPIQPNAHTGFCFRLWCCQCGGWHDPATMKADLDGEPFKAYYCLKCLDEMGGA